MYQLLAHLFFIFADGENGLPALLDEIQAAAYEYGVSLTTAQRVLINIRVATDSDLKMADMQPMSDFFTQFPPDSDITWGIAKDATLSASAIGVDMLCANLK